MEKPEVASLTSIFAGANWYERECWDMYGVVFAGHPYLKRLLLYDEFVGHPLRKDYPILKMQPLIPMRNAVDYEAVAIKNRQDAEEEELKAMPMELKDKFPELAGKEADAFDIDPMYINMGPSHPAMHGTVKLVLKLDGETVVGADMHIGYLHRCFEKTVEHKTWNQVIPYTDRLNYVSP